MAAQSGHLSQRPSGTSTFLRGFSQGVTTPLTLTEILPFSTRVSVTLGAFFDVFDAVPGEFCNWAIDFSILFWVSDGTSRTPLAEKDAFASPLLTSTGSRCPTRRRQHLPKRPFRKQRNNCCNRRASRPKDSFIL